MNKNKFIVKKLLRCIWFFHIKKISQDLPNDSFLYLTPWELFLMDILIDRIIN
ncbi:hypothetical protein LCGC14_1189570, partial [marine sediment metagenome]